MALDSYVDNTERHGLAALRIRFGTAGYGWPIPNANAVRTKGNARDGFDVFMIHSCAEVPIVTDGRERS